MTARLDGAVAIVTGATGGLGRACAQVFAAAGADVALVARSAEALQALAEELGGRVPVRPCDATVRAELEAAVGALPVPDVLVTCVGGNRPEDLLAVSDEALEWSWRINVRSAFLATQVCARRMIAASRPGAIVHVTSQMGHVGAPQRTAYCAAKHAVEGLTKAAALELAPYGIRVNAVAPTFVETPMTRPFLADPATRRSIERRIPLGRLGEPEEVADAVLFAACSPLMTGASLIVDGGWTAG